MRIDGRGHVKLSTRERDIVREVADGSPYKAIAFRLGISTHTLSNHIYKLFAGLRISTGKTGLVNWVWGHPKALEGEWVDPAMHPIGCKCRELFCRLKRRQAA